MRVVISLTNLHGTRLPNKINVITSAQIRPGCIRMKPIAMSIQFLNILNLKRHKKKNTNFVRDIQTREFTQLPQIHSNNNEVVVIHSLKFNHLGPKLWQPFLAPKQKHEAITKINIFSHPWFFPMKQNL